MRIIYVVILGTCQGSFFELDSGGDDLEEDNVVAVSETAESSVRTNGKMLSPLSIL